MRMLVAVVLAIAAATAAPVPAFAGEPTATGTPETATPASSTSPIATPTVPYMTSDFEGASVVWEPVIGAARYEVAATANVLRINGADICAAPLHRDRRDVSLSETVTAATLQLRFDLPEIAPDEWFVVTGKWSIRTFDSDNELIAFGGASIIAETCMRQADPTPARQLPATGSGGGPETNAHAVLGAMIATAAATTLVLAGMYGIHRRIRVRDE